MQHMAIEEIASPYHRRTSGASGPKLGFDKEILITKKQFSRAPQIGSCKDYMMVLRISAHLVQTRILGIAGGRVVGRAITWAVAHAKVLVDYLRIPSRLVDP
jgi:hypothetical protein